MAFCLLLHQVDIPGMKIFILKGSGSKRKGSGYTRARVAVVSPLLSALKIRVLRSNQGFFIGPMTSPHFLSHAWIHMCTT